MRNLPSTSRRNSFTTAPYGASDGAVILHAGRYARENVLIAFEMIGGVEAMAAWAEENPSEFYTKLFGKVVTREVEVQGSVSIEDMLSRIDKNVPSRRNYSNGSDSSDDNDTRDDFDDVQDADFEIMEDDDE